jgi:hypothetical protein
MKGGGAPEGANRIGRTTRTDVTTCPRHGRGARHGRSAYTNRPLRARSPFGAPPRLWPRFLGLGFSTSGQVSWDAALAAGVIGKSHLLAKAAENAIADGFPVLLFLGQDFTQPDPRTSILDRIDLRGRSFETLLGALDAAAIAADGRALILIDALNEGDGLTIWPKELSRLIEEVRRFPS